MVVLWAAVGKDESFCVVFHHQILLMVINLLTLNFVTSLTILAKVNARSLKRFMNVVDSVHMPLFCSKVFSSVPSCTSFVKTLPKIGKLHS